MSVVEHATCLGCGCTCDDIDVVVSGGRIVDARRACTLGIAWFGDGTVPSRSRVGGQDASVDEALDAAARLLERAGHPLVYLAPDVTMEAQREAVAIADRLRATLDTVTSSTTLPMLLASQERGWATATLGEIRNRADVMVFWGVDPAVRYPRYTSRYAPDPPGLHVSDGRRSRTVVAVDVGERRGPGDADVRVAIAPEQEVATIVALRALVAPAGAGGPCAEAAGDTWDRARDLAPILLGGRYVALVHDGEPVPGAGTDRFLECADALLALGQALNVRTRCALSTLRAGGNRAGADAVLVAQTGFPVAIDFARGAPSYRPHDATAQVRLADRVTDAALVIGSLGLVPDAVAAALEPGRCAVLGPRASASSLGTAHVVIDTAVAGIHEAGTALRMDEVPLPLRAALPGPPGAADLVRRLLSRIRPRALARVGTGAGA